MKSKKKFLLVTSLFEIPEVKLDIPEVKTDFWNLDNKPRRRRTRPRK